MAQSAPIDVQALDNSVEKSAAVQRYWDEFCTATRLEPGDALSGVVLR